MDLENLDSEHWCTLLGAGSAKTPKESLSVAAEIFILHERFDDMSTINNAEGLMINRHIWPGRSIKSMPSITRDDPGEDQTPCGAHISLASQERGEDQLGGELLALKTEQHEQLSAHQFEWDFLQEHVDKAYALYHQSASPWPNPRLTDWQKVEALARYAMRWKMRTANVYDSFHPVDVLFHSSYCTGSATILQALAMVAGFKTRFIAISNHSTIEILVNGRWIWADNIWADGGVTPSTFNYAEMTSDPKAIVSFTDMQKEFYSSVTARYRSPWHYSGSFYWHFISGEAKGRGIRNDIDDGFGLSVPYDPSTACALYPEMKQHAFFSPKDWQPCINISEKGALIRASYTLTNKQALRKVFYLSACDDNPICGGVVKFRLAQASSADNFICTLDGHSLKCAGNGQRYKQDTIDFHLPTELLTHGTHEIHLSVKNDDVQIIVYPDIVEPYYPPLYDDAATDVNVEDDAFSIEPTIPPAELELLREPLLSENAGS